MKRSASFTLLTILAAIVPTLAYATSSYTLTPPASDLSFQYLSNIFGVVSGVLHGSGTQIFGKMFNVFNSSVLALGGIVVTYTFMVSTLNTAGQGEVMGKEWSSIWIPIRSAGGIALLLPKGTGYSAIQVFMMWVIVQGIGAADRIWDTTLDYLKLGGVIIQQNATGISGTFGATSALPAGAQAQGMQAVAKLFINTICLESYQASLQTTYAAHTNYGVPPDVFSLISTQIGHYQANPASRITIGLPWITSGIANHSQLSALVNADAISNYSIHNQCGSILITLPTPLTSANNSALAQARLIAVQQMINDLQAAAMVVQTQYLATQIPTSQLGSRTLPTMSLGFGDCPVPRSPCAGTGGGVCSGTTGTCTNPTLGNGALSSTLFQDTLADYIGIVYAASQGGVNASATPNGAGLSAALISGAKQDGWLMAGSYYINLANANNNANNFTKAWGSSFPITVNRYSDTNAPTGILSNNTAVSAINKYLNGAMNYYTAQGNTGTENNATGTIVANSLSGIVVILGVVAPIFIPIITGIIDIFTGMGELLHSQQSNVNPIAAIAIMGGGMMNVSIGFFITGAVIAFALALGLGAVPCVNLGDAPVAMISWVAPLMSGFVAMMFSSGAMMAYYIPLIPFILFTFAGIGWLISVIEAMVAAPLVALGIAHPEGHQAFGKGEPAIMLTANVFLKPSLMLFGYIGGISMSYVGIWILNRGFMSAFYNTVGSMLSQGVIGSIFAIIGMPIASICFYTILCTIIVQKAFSLIHVIPERVLKWIGGSVEGHMEAQMEQEAKAGMQKGAQEGGQMAGGGVKSAGEEVHKESMDKRREAGKKKFGAQEAGGGNASLQSGSKKPGGASGQQPGGGQNPGGQNPRGRGGRRGRGGKGRR